MKEPKYLLVGKYRWGKGATPAAALRNLNGVGGRRHRLKECSIYKWDAAQGDLYIDDFGRITSVAKAEDGDADFPVEKVQTGSLFK